jgi:hypothetical protein
LKFSIEVDVVLNLPDELASGDVEIRSCVGEWIARVEFLA